MDQDVYDDYVTISLHWEMQRVFQTAWYSSGCTHYELATCMGVVTDSLSLVLTCLYKADQ